MQQSVIMLLRYTKYKGYASPRKSTTGVYSKPANVVITYITPPSPHATSPHITCTDSTIYGHMMI